MSDYSDRTQGALFANHSKKAANHPDFRGELTISKELLRELVELAKSGKDAKLEIAAWNKTSKGGVDYLSVSGSTYRERPAGAAPRRAPAPRGEDVPF